MKRREFVQILSTSVVGGLVASFTHDLIEKEPNPFDIPDGGANAHITLEKLQEIEKWALSKRIEPVEFRGEQCYIHRMDGGGFMTTKEAKSFLQSIEQVSKGGQ